MIEVTFDKDGVTCIVAADYFYFEDGCICMKCKACGTRLEKIPLKDVKHIYDRRQ